MGSENLKLGLLELSAVRELANIGLGHAMTALTELTGRSFNMSVPYAENVALTNLPEMLGDRDGINVGIYMPVEGDVEGHMAFLFPWAAAQRIWKMLLGSAPESIEDVSELEASAMLEVGNIINSSFLNAISDMTNYRLHATPPYVSVDYGVSILSAIVTEASYEEHAALAIETDIFDDQNEASGIFLYIPTVGGLKLMFNALGIVEAA
ncbi:MAG: chemotaxis protein CheC [Fimbriimonadaceae bacterium]|nr:chemotaxis protein CheC [Fimbriimonadaceae bacterium]